ncbi:uncharacterized protein pirk [Linepithema humile]|uniref:uncharacterized protein pirk n=1 Tax=Linepithema humile TaxID=83485 RepID=UPI000623148C|nr:PREDICTED: uncharacterized protein LOC105678813 [Linepithema humile]
MTIFHIDDQVEPKRKDERNKSSSVRRRERPSDERGAGNDAGDGIERFHGDGLVVRMHSNHRVLKVTGDGCQVVLSNNSGSVRIVGDGCKLRVKHNVGDIEYTGDGGRILLGSESKGKVKFVGDGGKVIFDSRSEAELNKSSKDRKNGGKIEGIIYACEKIIGATPKCEKCEDDSMPWNEEDQDSAVNDTKEGRREKCGKRNDETRKSDARHPTVTKIITKIRSDGQCVRKRFGNSSLIVNSRNNDRPVAKSSGTLAASSAIE